MKRVIREVITVVQIERWLIIDTVDPENALSQPALAEKELLTKELLTKECFLLTSTGLDPSPNLKEPLPNETVISQRVLKTEQFEIVQEEEEK